MLMSPYNVNIALCFYPVLHVCRDGVVTFLFGLTARCGRLLGPLQAGIVGRGGSSPEYRAFHA